MPIPTRNYPRQAKLVSTGAAYGVDAEVLGMQDAGEYIDARNARPNSVNKELAALEKINGETIEYNSEDNSCDEYYDTTFSNGNWYCMGTCMVKRHIVEFWCDKNGILDPFIRVDGFIVAAHPDLPISFIHPIQYHWNHDCPGGEVYITDYNQPSIILNVEDMLSKSGIPTGDCTEIYFSKFNLKSYEINLSLPAHHMAFIELTNNSGYQADSIYGSGGLKVGQYSYSFRYVNSTGDRTLLCNPTPLIPVPATVSYGSGHDLNYADDQYPGIKDYGDTVSAQSQYGIVLKFRVENFIGYSYIEIVRHSYNTGAAVGFTPGGEIIGTLPVVFDEVSVKTIVDMGAVGEPLTDEEDTGSTSGVIEAAKSVRYFENRLTFGNIKYASSDLTDTIQFTTRSGNSMFPVMQAMGKMGHDDPWYGTYKRNLQSGEKYGFGVGFFGPMLNRTFAVPVTGATNIKLPERRDVASADTQTFSYAGLAEAVVYDTNSNDKCHERFDLTDCIQKLDFCSFINIASDGSKGEGCDGDYGINHEPVPCDDVDLPVNAGDIGYKPLHPVGQGDSNVSGHNYAVTNRVFTGSANDSDVPFYPCGFAPNYFSGGMALNGIAKSSIPSWVQAFTVLRTRAAGRVVGQGMGFYKLNAGDYSSIGVGARGTKVKDKFWFYGSDFASWSGVVSQGTIDSINSNAGGRYKAQLVSPVGFFSEVPWGESRDLNRDVIDMCTYPRFYRDTAVINTNPDPTSTGSGNWVQFGKWRNSSFPSWVSSLNSNRGMFTIDQFTQANNSGTDAPDDTADFIGDRGGEYMVLGVTEDIYLNGSVGNNSEKYYDQDGLKDWQEPMYYVNIVDSLANVPQSTTTQYQDTGSYIKMHSIIAISDGTTTTDPNYDLVDERWEDCSPYTPNTYTTTVASVNANTINSLLFIENPDGTKETWLNADGVSNADLATLGTGFTIGSGSKAGTVISGFFRTQFATVNGIKRFCTIIFDVPGNIPVSGAKFYVDYDDEVPVQVFGGNTYIGDDVFCPVDRKIPNGGGAPQGQGQETPFFMDNGFPYFEFVINPRMLILNQAHNDANKIQDCSKVNDTWIRQMIAVFNTESKIHLPYGYEVISVDPRDFIFQKYFPATNYIQRPINWKTDPLSDNFEPNGHIWPAYRDDYYHEEFLWRYGGYRYRPNMNIDYLHENNVIIWSSRPKTGFKEQTLYCTRVIWSLRRDISKQDVPGLKTFMPGNKYDLEDSEGQIVYLWSSLGGNKGDNITALLDRGICMLPTNKDILRDATGEQIAAIKATADMFINSEYWINRYIGMNAEMWRTRAEYGNMLFFANLTSVYMLMDNELIDIGQDTKYFARIYEVLKNVNGNYPDPAGDGTWLTGYYDVKYREYVLQLATIELQQIGDDQEIQVEVFHTFGFNLQKKYWNGRYDYAYDQYLSFDDLAYGMGRKFDKTNSASPASSFLLDTGDYINDDVIAFEALIPFTPPEVSMDKEFCDFRISSNMKPTSIEFYDTVAQVNAGQPQCSVVASDMLDRNGYEQYIPRRDMAVAGNDNRFQGRTVILRVLHNSVGKFVIRNLSIAYRKLFIQ